MYAANVVFCIAAPMYWNAILVCKATGDLEYKLSTDWSPLRHYSFKCDILANCVWA